MWSLSKPAFGGLASKDYISRTSEVKRTEIFCSPSLMSTEDPEEGREEWDGDRKRTHHVFAVPPLLVAGPGKSLEQV